MFRKPREHSESPLRPVLPSVGRPPSPPATPSASPRVPAPKSAMAATAKPMPLPTIGRQGPTGSARKSAAPAKGKSKPNASILSFFKKADSVGDAADLFVQSTGPGTLRVQNEGSERSPSALAAEPTPEDEPDPYILVDSTRYHEDGGPSKRRKCGVPEDSNATAGGTETPYMNGCQKSGPFLEDSEDEDEIAGLQSVAKHESAEDVDSAILESSYHTSGIQVRQQLESTPLSVGSINRPLLERPPLIKEETSYGLGEDGFKDFEGMGDFDEDLFEEGDEFLERKYEEEQARLESLDDENDHDPLPLECDGPLKQEGNGEVTAKAGAPTCPICSISLAEVADKDTLVHVNNCLDGIPTPLPENKKPTSPVSAVKTEASASAAQYRRPVRPAKPGQQSPFTLGQVNMNGSSAFNKLMSGHAEDAAWASAAAEEHASRGKPAYRRTCPFYKILPGLFICVDAFRYGAVEGCQAYFLSHFHSDHYIGLTSTWCHGPIYCSHVTANLVRQQLRVDPKWVVDLEFEKQVEVPGTRGVRVTMIPANHCPGSSLYLFEKIVAPARKGKEPKLQRILHCGDFRACRAHVEHPLLMPDVQDKITGKQKEQRIDVCYLDTTYLNAKYAFPGQEAVIKACADMCVSLSKVQADESDGWEQMKRQRAGEGMVKFVRKDSSAGIKAESPGDDDMEGVKLERNPNGSQQVLTHPNTKGRGRLLVVVGTYSIGKERICMGIARALDSKIYAPPGKQRICAALEDAELNARLTSDPREAQVHMTPLFEIRAETLDDYLKDYFPTFTRAVGFRPSGWNYRPPHSRFTDSPAVHAVLHSDAWRSDYTMRELVPQRGSTSRASCFGVPYSEHSSFRELTMFCCALRIERIIPTVNVGSAKSREKMKGWCERWMAERRKNGLFAVASDEKW